MAFNPFARFKALVPDPPLQIGDVIAVEDGVATIEVPTVGSGVLATARGDASPGLRVFFRDGAIEGPAPDLTLEIIDLT